MEYILRRYVSISKQLRLQSLSYAAKQLRLQSLSYKGWFECIKVAQNREATPLTAN